MASHEIRVSGKHRGSEGRRRTKMKCHAGHAYKMLTVCLRDVRFALLVVSRRKRVLEKEEQEAYSSDSTFNRYKTQNTLPTPQSYSILCIFYTTLTRIQDISSTIMCLWQKMACPFRRACWHLQYRREANQGMYSS